MFFKFIKGAILNLNGQRGCDKGSKIKPWVCCRLRMSIKHWPFLVQKGHLSDDFRSVTLSILVENGIRSVNGIRSNMR